MAFPPNASVQLNDGKSVPPVGLGVWQMPADDTERAVAIGKHETTPAQVLIRSHVQLGNIVIPKSVHPERIVSEQDMASIASLDDGSRLGPDPRTFNFTG